MNQTMQRLLRAGLCGLALLLAAAPGLRADVITFDGLADGTVINTYYAGLTFSNPLGGDIYARSTSGAESASNVVSVFATGIPSYSAYYGAVDVTFSTLQSSVSIDASPMLLPEGLGTVANRPYLEAYDASNNFLGRVLYAGTLPGVGGTGPYETLTFTSGSANIAKMRFSVQQSQGGPNVYGFFDNLTYGTGGPVDGQVPEPSSLLFLGTGLISITGAVRRKLHK